MARARLILAPAAFAILLVGCGEDSTPAEGADCVGLACFQVTCQGGNTTSVSGIVYTPSGTLPVYGAKVYVPSRPVEPLSAGPSCTPCGTELSGSPLVQTTTDAEGRFTLTNVPATQSVPLVIQVGRWRRRITIPNVTPCVDTPVSASQTRLPSSQSDGDIPRIALATGGADALECLLRKVGIADSEFTVRGGGGRVHLYAGTSGTNQFAAGLGGGSFPPATSLWGSPDSLAAYDIVLLSCEGAQNTATKPASAVDALFDYVGAGGRAYLGHWHNYWIQAGPSPWPQSVTLNFFPDLGNLSADVDQTHVRGSALASWLVSVGASSTLGQINITQAQHTVTAVDEAVAEPLITKEVTSNGLPTIQCVAFRTPLTAPAANRCGRVVFCDIHAAAGDVSSPGTPFPEGCTSGGLTPQEKAIVFMLFDLAACAGP